MSHVWFFLILSGMAWAAATGKMEGISRSFFLQAKEAVIFGIGLAGGMAFWSGLVKIAEESGLTSFLAKISLKPLLMLFPSIRNHPRALKAISISIWANIMGLGNATTPLGIKAMEELQKINRDKTRASPAMCTYMVLIMGGLTLLPGSVLILRTEAGSAKPGMIILPTILATMAGTVIALILDRIFQSCQQKRLSQSGQNQNPNNLKKLVI